MHRDQLSAEDQLNVDMGRTEFYKSRTVEGGNEIRFKSYTLYCLLLLTIEKRHQEQNIAANLVNQLN